MLKIRRKPDYWKGWKGGPRPRGEKIQLGLKRILQLFPPRNVSWDAIHVAGTNGKGSVCFYASQMLRSTGLNVGRFTSPHLVDRWDGINIDGKPVAEGLFKNVEKHYRRKNEIENIGASSFEILTATAFELFCMHAVDVAVVEVGVGGLEDATNIIPQESLLCAVITQIGWDHEGLLGKTMQEIATHKAGIIKPGAPVVYDRESGSVARRVIADHVKNPLPTSRDWTPIRKVRNVPQFEIIVNSHTHDLHFPIGNENHHRQEVGKRIGPFGDNFLPDNWAKTTALAATATRLSLRRLDKPWPDMKELQDLASVRQWPGRLQSLSLQPLVDRQNAVLLDGAHNQDSALRLGRFLERRFEAHYSEQGKRKPITWVIGVSTGKELQRMLRYLLQDGDMVFTVEFGPVDGMPWVSPTNATALLEEASKLFKLASASTASMSIEAALKMAADEAKEGPMVVTGSLYLVSDVLRLLRSTGDDPPEVWWQRWEVPVKFDTQLWHEKAGLKYPVSILDAYSDGEAGQDGELDENVDHLSFESQEVLQSHDDVDSVEAKELEQSDGSSTPENQNDGHHWDAADITDPASSEKERR